MMVLEYCAGGDLGAAIKALRADAKNGFVIPFGLALFVDWARQIAEGMAHIYRSKMFHRDLKPANVLLLKSCTGSPAGIFDMGYVGTAIAQASRAAFSKPAAVA